jgi:hypothetical protein
VALYKRKKTWWTDQTIMAIAGHVSPKMLAHYSHVRMDPNERRWTLSLAHAQKAVMAQTTTQTASSTLSLIRKSLK